MRLTSSLSGWLAVLIAGCGSSPALLQESPSAAASAPITVQEAFSRAAPLTPGKGPNVAILPGQVPLVTLGAATVLAVPATIDGSKPWTVIVRSRVMRRSDGTHVLFYPVISIVDEGFNAALSLKPTYEFSFSNSENILSNEFKIPIGTKRLLIHTTDEYVRGSFVGVLSLGTDTGALSAAALGGAIGAAVVLAANLDANQTDLKEYRLGEVGMISVEAR